MVKVGVGVQAEKIWGKTESAASMIRMRESERRRRNRGTCARERSISKI